MKLIPFFSKAAALRSSPWPWPYCYQPKTLSFRAGETVSSDFVFDSPAPEDSGGWGGGGEAVETVIRGLRSERLFFEPGETSSILVEAKRDCGGCSDGDGGGEGGLLLPSLVTMESEDPYGDFKRSMEEMVEAHGLMDWECLQELLGCYLRVNAKKNHGYIVGAFVDLLIGLSIDSPSSSSSSSNNSSSDCCSSSCSASSSPLSLSYLSSSSSSSSSTTTSSSSSSMTTTTPCSSSLESAEEKPGGVEKDCSS
ncbi:transcription repressor OFP15-like [Malania oleifera]|uniref:transcription repressor OFP15-like n=1 Tax=Malania oleifera TaxID=397392 RepID=UPI0025ADB378|nr:transcription repressor OFP15-like [Malania oleifera]